MRFSPLILIAALAAIAPVKCLAQQDDTGTGDANDNAIHAITSLRDDGSKTVTVTDPDKHTSQATTYNTAGHIVEKVVYTLDDNNNPVTGIVYGPDNAAAFKAEYKRDETNRMSEEDDYTLADVLIRRFVYEYDGGSLKRIHAFDAQGNEMRQSDAVPDPPRSHH
jgi:hypothetical protein